MAIDSKIEWTDHTFNPWIGCTKVSPGCAHCYAEHSTRARVLRAQGHETWGKGEQRSRTSVQNWREPVIWNKKAAAAGTRAKVFCASLADWLDDEVPIEWLAELLALMFATPNLDWQMVTKRPGNWRPRITAVRNGMTGHVVANIEAIVETRGKTGRPCVDVPIWLNDWLQGKEPNNVWIGTTVEDGPRQDRIGELLKIPAKVRFLSCEPLLSDLFLGDYLACDIDKEDDPHWQGRTIDWVICGGESGSKARPMHPDWARSLRDQCQAAGVAFFFKQWGEWKPICEPGDWHEQYWKPNRRARDWEDQSEINESFGKHCTVDYRVLHSDGKLLDPLAPKAFWQGTGAMTVFKVGKAAAGRLLDGREWNEFPKV